MLADQRDDVEQEEDQEGKEGVVQQAQKDVHDAAPATKRIGTVPKRTRSP